jgi:hypothetical protein
MIAGRRKPARESRRSRWIGRERRASRADYRPRQGMHASLARVFEPYPSTH